MREEPRRGATNLTKFSPISFFGKNNKNNKNNSKKNDHFNQLNQPTNPPTNHPPTLQPTNKHCFLCFLTFRGNIGPKRGHSTTTRDSKVSRNSLPHLVNSGRRSFPFFFPSRSSSSFGGRGSRSSSSFGGRGGGDEEVGSSRVGKSEGGRLWEEVEKKGIEREEDGGELAKEDREEEEDGR